MNEQDRKAIERANSYREMMNLWAWKDFMAIIEGLKNEPINVLDSVSISELTVPIVAEAFGFRRAFRRLEAELGYILDGRK